MYTVLYDFIADHPQFAFPVTLAMLLASTLERTVDIPILASLERVETIVHILLMVVTILVGLTSVLSYLEKKGLFKWFRKVFTRKKKRK